jgi:DnaJ-class molecular chaperone
MTELSRRLGQLLDDLGVEVYFNNPTCEECQGRGWINGKQCEMCIKWRNESNREEDK